MEAVAGSVPGALLTSAPCALAVVPGPHVHRPGTEVVVVATGSLLDPTPAVAFAHRTAADLGQRLVAVICSADVPDEFTVVDMVDRHRARLPGVPTTWRLVAGDPTPVVIEESRRASLMVLADQDGAAPLCLPRCRDR